MAGLKAFDRMLLPLFDSDWLSSSLCDIAVSSTICFSFVSVYQCCVIPVTTGIVRVLENEFPNCGYCGFSVLKTGAGGAVDISGRRKG